MITIALAELRLIVRNRTTLVMATVLPLGFIALMLVTGRNERPEMTVLHVMMMMGFTVFLTGTTTLTSRRQQLYLKRLRSSPAPVSSIVAGLIGPLVLLSLLQIVLFLGLAGQLPGRPLLLLAAALTAAVTWGAFAFLTAAFTRTPEAAQITTAPVYLLLFGGMFWVLNTPVDAVSLPQLLVPGGAISQLIRLSWDGPVGTAPLTLALCAAIAAAAVAVAVRTFRWEPRA
ncbi:ABC transporter permease [Nonomuraea soli]|uniref:ABC-2 type transport system permease protein n=1 Tax=Nonomuraea soli TaxID=1032476 RepID=A0A7W0CL09_9ACTN|nr:ABC transporter permease [Nonomuraea soli]MBA2893009.1 ABC-2 type transport system permease protein [Nonomuraea soli]